MMYIQHVRYDLIDIYYWYKMQFDQRNSRCLCGSETENTQFYVLILL